MRIFLSLIFVTFLSFGCATSDSTLRQSGHNDAYIQGFHDGRHSGLQEAGNHYESYIKDEQRFASDKDYQKGWLAGEAEGKELQRQATSVGEGIAGSYRVKGDKTDPEKVAKDVLKNVDTKELKSLEKEQD